MSQTTHKSFPLFQTSTLKSEVTPEGNTVIKDVVIIQGGMDKVGDYISKDFLTTLVEQGNNHPKGIKSRFGHPDMCKTTLGSELGRIKNFRLTEENGVAKAIGDLYLLELSKKTQVEGRGISMHDFVVGLAKEDHGMFGNSIVFTCDADLKEMDIEGEAKEVNFLTLKNFMASDLVDSPAATTDLFKDSEDLGMKLGTFLENNPEVFDIVEKSPETVTAFFKRYATLKGKNIDMNILKSITGILTGKSDEEVKNIDLTTTDGVILTIVTEANEPAEGDKVQIDGSPAADGDYPMTDGSTISVEGGSVTGVTADETEGDETEEEVTEVTEVLSTEALDEVKELIEGVRKSVTDAISDINDRLAKSDEDITTFKGDVLESMKKLAKAVSSEMDIDLNGSASHGDDLTGSRRIEVVKN